MEFGKFEDSINVSFNDKALLKQAFTHRSYINEHPNEGLQHNERLEFLGDAVLELVMTEFLYEKYADKPEGELTAYRAALVNTQSISDAAAELNVNDYLLLSKGEAKDTGRARQYILANTYEAIIGAIYLDQQYDAAKEFIKQTLFHKADEIVEKNLWQDAKSRFQELAQEKEGITPVYQLVDETGPDHDKTFVSGVFLNDTEVARGEGRSKQEAEQAAAEAALVAKNW